jgi:Chalcone isomerase-like
MKRAPAISAAALLAVASVLCALEVGGVKLSDSVTVDGKTLKLNGAGVRKKAIFKIYVASLYLESPAKDAASVIASGQAKSMRLHMLRSVEGAKVSGAIIEGFEMNSKEALPKLKGRLDQLARMIPDVKDGDEIALSWIPHKGTQVAVRGTVAGTIEGRDFADALFAVWLGPNPVQDDLKSDLLGG